MSGKKIKTMEEFSTLSGVSRPTVSKYFQDPLSVRRSTRARIEAALGQCDYRPNIYAVNQNRNLTNNIGIIVPYLTDPFFSEISRKIEEIVIEKRFNPILLNSKGSAAQEVRNLESLKAIKPAGVLLAALGRSSDIAALESFCSEIPTVLFDSHVENVGAAFVGSNNAQSLRLIVEHLCETGEPPAFFEMKQPTNPNAEKRRAIYLSVMEEMGFEPHLLQVKGDGWNFEEIGFKEGRQALKQASRFTDTVLCSNDRLAIGLLSAAYEMGLRVGNGARCALRIAGHDDHPYSRYTCPTLTTVSQDYHAISETSVDTLIRLIGDDPSPIPRKTTLFDGTLVLRGSA